MNGSSEGNITAANGGRAKMGLASVLGSKDEYFLLSPCGTQVKVSDVEDKAIGLYFSANWNSSCRNFTHILTNVYHQLKTSGCDFEVIFVSSDENLEAFDDYRACMPWLALPFSDVLTKKALNLRFDIEDIPSLIILNQNSGGDSNAGAALQDGVELIYRYGVRAFPFTKERVEELRREERELHEKQTLDNLLTNHNRNFLLSHSVPQEVPVASIMGKTIGLYFAAHWCLPCLNFTPKLVSTYHKIKQTLAEQQARDGFEIVFVSTDRNETEFRSYFGRIPWLTLPFGDSSVKTLIKHFDVRTIPCLVIIGPDGKTVTQQGRNFINLYGEDAYPFTKAKVEFLEKQMEEEAKSLPRMEHHAGHPHMLTLVSEGNGGGPFICCDCDEQGKGWAYQCMECGYEVHPRCVRALGHALPTTSD